jgi:hypothetical protein
MYVWGRATERPRYVAEQTADTLTLAKEPLHA